MPQSIKFNLILLFSLFNNSSFASSNDLIDIVSYGVTHNIALKADKQILIESDFDINIERSNLLPTLAGSLNTSWNSNNQSNISKDIYKSYNSHGYSLSLNQKILDFEMINKYKTKKLDYSLEELKYSNKVQELILTISTKYFEFLKIKSQIIATEFELKSSQMREKQIIRNIELGNIAANELYEVVTQKEAVSNKLRTLRKDQTTTLREVFNLIQTQKEPLYDIKEELLFSLIDNNLKTLILKDSLESNTELLIAKKNIAINHNKLKESKASFLPTISLSGNIGYNNSNDYDKSDLNQTGISNSNSISLNINIPITSGGSDYYRLEKSLISIQKNELLYKDTYFNTIMNIDNSIANLNDISKSIESYSNIIRNSYASYLGIQKAYQLGTRTITDLLAAENKQFNALRDYQNSRYDYFLELLNLEKLKGTLSLNFISKLSKSSMGPIDNNIKIIPNHLIDYKS